jgi:tetratricopeptide (TPR) repeat protein
LALSLTKLFLFFDSDPFPEATIYKSDFYKDNFTNSLKFPLISYGFLSFFFIIGFFMYLKESEKSNLIIILFITFLFMILLSSVNLRTKISITPLMIIFSAFSINRIVYFFKENKLQKIVLPLVIAIGIFVVNIFFVAKPKISEFDGYLNLGNFYQDQKRYDEAIYNYNRSIMLKDEYVTFLNLGKTFAKKSDYKNSLSAFNEAEKRNSNDYMLFYNKGFVYSQMGNYDKSLESFDKAVKLNPQYAPTYRSIRIIFFVAEKFPEAKRYFQKFLSISKDEKTNELVRQDLNSIEMKLRGN